MIIGLGKALLRWRWLITLLMALMVIAIETVEHRPDRLNGFDPQLMGELLVFGLGFPLSVGMILTALASTIELEPDPSAASLRDQAGKNGRQRVLVVQYQLLLGAGIKSLLSGEAGLELVGISPGDEAELIREIRKLRPNVVILDKATCLTDPPRLLSLLGNYPEVRLVVISANDNWVRLYDKKQVRVTQTTTLANVVRCSHSQIWAKE